MTDTQNTATPSNDVFIQLANDYMKEKRRKRRWGIFFKSIFLIWLIFILVSLYSDKALTSKKPLKAHTALIDITGPIFVKSSASADNIAKSLRYAFKDEKTAGIILRINSPGGSPVQADYIYNEILRLRKKNPKKKVYAVCTDACASAAYYIAVAADEIYANPSSMVGSIGVLYNGFGFVDVMEKVGVQRRLVTSGNNKGFMDPFSPLKPQDEQTLQNMLNLVHQQFITRVKAGRGKRLKDNPEIFSGLFWAGVQAKELGLIDNFGSPGFVAREIIKNENIVDYTVKPNYIERIAKRFGTAFSDGISSRLNSYDTVMR